MIVTLGIIICILILILILVTIAGKDDVQKADWLKLYTHDQKLKELENRIDLLESVNKVKVEREESARKILNTPTEGYYNGLG
jgi:hypothetical protein